METDRLREASLGYEILILLIACLFAATVPAFGAPLTWTGKASAPSAASRAFSGVANGKLYLLGGTTGSGPTSAVQVYDPAGDTWQAHAPLPEPRFGGAEAVQGNMVYLAGGGGAANSEQSLLAYNTDTGSCTPLGSLITPRFGAAAAIVDNKMYVIGGSNSSDGVLNTIEEHDLSTGASVIKSTLLPGARELATAVALNGRIYIVGGMDASGAPSASCWEYDPAANSITAKNPLPYARGGREAIAFDGRIYTAGGITSSGFPPSAWTRDLLAYDPPSNSWSTVDVFPSSRYAFAAKMINSTLYLIGGDDGQQHLAINEAASLPVAWTVHSSGPQPGNPFNLPANSSVDWPTAQHDSLVAGDYLRIGGVYYFIVGSTRHSWSGVAYNAATLQQCDQTTKLPLPDGNGLPLFADTRGTAGASIVTTSFGPVPGIDPLTVTFSGQGSGSVDLSSAIYAAGFYGNFSQSLPTGTGVTLAASAGNGSVFTGWTGCDAVNGSQCFSTMAGSRYITATFVTAAPSYPFSLTVHGGGEVHSAPSPDINCSSGTCTQQQVSGTLLELTASPASGFDFAGWTGCDSVNGPVCTVSVNAARSVAATFVSPTPSWAVKAPLPISVSRAASGSINGKLYVAGGLLRFPPQSDNMTTAVQVYDPQTNSWQAGTPLCAKVMGGAGATRGDVLYLAGGFNTGMTPLNSVLAYNTQTGSCSQVGTLVTARSRVNAAIIENRLYIAGGDGTSGSLDTIEEVNLDTGKSSIRRTVPQPLSAPGIAAYGSKIYIMGGGNTSGAPVATAYAYDPADNSLAALAPMPVATQVRHAYHYGSKLYTVGGFSSNIIQAYDPAANSWQVVTNVPTPRDAPQSGIINGTLYVAGGDGLTVNEAYTLTTPQWVVHSYGPPVPNPHNLPAKSAIDWPAAQHDFIVAGNYLQVAGTYYFILGSTKGSWNGATYNSAVLQQCDQATRQPLYSNGQPLYADLSTAVGRGILLQPFGLPAGYYPLTTTFAGSGSGAVTTVIGPMSDTVTSTGSVAIFSPGGAVEAKLSATSDSGSTFSGWSGDCKSVSGNLCTVDLNVARSVTATFTTSSITYAVTPSAGQHGSISPAAPQTVFPGGIVSFAVTPDAGYHIGTVTGCGGTLSGTTYRTGPVTADCAVAASFAADDPASICSTADMVWFWGGTEGRRDYNCASTQESTSGYCYDFKTDMCGGYRRISGNDVDPGCYAECPGGACVHIPTQKQLCAATPFPYPLSLTVSGGSGLVHSDVLPDINCATGTCSRTYVSGTKVDLTAIPAAGFDFASWTGCDSFEGNVCTVSMTIAKRVTAKFTAEGQMVFSQAEGMTQGRYYHTATLLQNGRVLVTGGANDGHLTSCEFYDPASDRWSPAANLAQPRAVHTATLLSDGKVLVTGGYGTTSAERYDPATDTWSPAGDMAQARTGHTATLLPGGKVLVAGGYASPAALASCELYDPATNSWTSAASLAGARNAHTATLLSNGKVLVAGGSTLNGTGNGSLDSAEIYDPDTDTWSPAGNLAYARNAHTATLLAGGKILVAGGWADYYSEYCGYTTAEIYDPATNNWNSGGMLVGPRFSHTATLLPTGKVLLAGGYLNLYTYNGVLNTSELYDPAVDSWSAAAELSYGREYFTATLLQNGKVLVAGGVGHNAVLSTTEIYGPVENSFPLSVTLTGDGTGTVHTSPSPDMACFSGVCNQSFPKGTTLTLTAAPSSGFVFAGWGGACSGSGQCQVTMNGAKGVTAVFKAAGDTTPPTVTGFGMPSAATSLSVPVNTFTASDNVAITGYLITESSVAPPANATGWSGSPPATFSFIAPGNCYAYAWAKDAAGNVSAFSAAMVNVVIPDPEADTLAPLITSFMVPSSSSLTVPVTLAVTDNVGVTGYVVSESSVTPLPADARWSGGPPANFTSSTHGSKILYVWAKDQAGNLSAGVMATFMLIDPAQLLDTVLTGWPGTPMLFSPSTFTFIANKAGATFECSLDNQSYFACASPISFGSLANGSHTLSVRSKDAANNYDLTPANYTWTVSLPLVQVLLNSYTNVSNAYSGISTGEVLQVRGIEFKENLVFNRPIDITLKGGYDAAYLNANGTSIIHGSIAVRDGKVNLQNVRLR